MRVPLFRSLAFPSVREACTGDTTPFFMYSFAPIEPEDPRMLIGSGPFAFCHIEVPDGSEVVCDALLLPDYREPLHPSEVAACCIEPPAACPPVSGSLPIRALHAHPTSERVPV